MEKKYQSNPFSPLNELLNTCTNLVTEFESRCRLHNDRIIEEMTSQMIKAAKVGDTKIKYSAEEFDLHPNQVRVINQRFRYQAQLKCSYDKVGRVFTLSLPADMIGG